MRPARRNPQITPRRSPITAPIQNPPIAIIRSPPLVTHPRRDREFPRLRLAGSVAGLIGASVILAGAAPRLARGGRMSRSRRSEAVDALDEEASILEPRDPAVVDVADEIARLVEPDDRRRDAHPDP